MKFRRVMWVILIVSFFAVIGTAYGAWRQEIPVLNTFDTAEFDGDFRHTSSSESESTLTRDVNFNKQYAIRVTRNKRNMLEVTDGILMDNKLSTMPIKYYIEEPSDFTSVLIFNYELESIRVIEMALGLDQEEIILTSGRAVVEIPSEDWRFSIEYDRERVSDLSYENFIKHLDEIVSQGLDGGEEKKILITERFTGHFDDYKRMADELILKNGERIKDYDYTVSWAYNYDVNQVPISK